VADATDTVPAVTDRMAATGAAAGVDEAAPEPLADPDPVTGTRTGGDPDAEEAAVVAETADLPAGPDRPDAPAAFDTGEPDGPTLSEGEIKSEVATAAETGTEPTDAGAAPAALPPAPGYAVDDSVLAILREEAEREATARRVEALESQTDLGIEAAMPAKVGAAALAESRPSARRDLLPDVEEINSTLRPSEVQAEADGPPDFAPLPPEAPRGFRSGFLTLMTIAILCAALYLVAPRLAVMLPGLAGPLEAYVSMIDGLRLGLDGMMRSATVAISDG
jgi:resuscitation-promoting factor RpfA